MKFQTNLQGVGAGHLKGFFVGWPKAPSTETHFQLLQNSSYVVLALSDDDAKVIGFITAISDLKLSAYIPLLEVLPEYQNKGIGKQLVTKMLQQLDHLYMIDLSCDKNLIPFYEKHGFVTGNAMLKRNYHNQGA